MHRLFIKSTFLLTTLLAITSAAAAHEELIATVQFSAPVPVRVSYKNDSTHHALRYVQLNDASFQIYQIKLTEMYWGLSIHVDSPGRPGCNITFMNDYPEEGDGLWLNDTDCTGANRTLKLNLKMNREPGTKLYTLNFTADTR